MVLWCGGDEGIVPSLHMLTASLTKKNSFADGRGCGIRTGERGVSDGEGWDTK